MSAACLASVGQATNTRTAWLLAVLPMWLPGWPAAEAAAWLPGLFATTKGRWELASACCSLATLPACSSSGSSMPSFSSICLHFFVHSLTPFWFQLFSTCGLLMVPAYGEEPAFAGCTAAPYHHIVCPQCNNIPAVGHYACDNIPAVGHYPCGNMPAVGHYAGDNIPAVGHYACDNIPAVGHYGCDNIPDLGRHAANLVQALARVLKLDTSNNI